MPFDFRDLPRLAPRAVYAVYAWSTLLVVGLLALIGVLLLPRLTWRRQVAKAASRLFLRLIGMSLAVSREQHLPSGQCVVVSNHASYLDGIVFMAVLPPRFGFVIKREMSGVPLAGALLHRIGSEFVERFNRHKSAADARRVLRQAARGNSLVFFPEGTFSPEPGLLKFHTGAFATAVRAGCPVVPAVVRGTRRALSAHSIVPQPGPIEIEFLPPLLASAGVRKGASVERDAHAGAEAGATARAAAPEHAATELRDRARAAILSRLAEPDLTRSDDTDRLPDTALARSGRASSS